MRTARREAAPTMPYLDRTAVEVFCSFRPETADALWKCDVGEWSCPRVRTYEPKSEFIVTTNGAYHRREVLDFRHALDDYVPTKHNVVLVPCAADKPYPSPLHSAVLAMLPSDFYLMNATGVLGLVPQDMWPIMPHYDSGIPNEWRLYQTVQSYFTRNSHNRIIIYCDYYSVAIAEALESAGIAGEFVNEIKFYYNYLDLLDPKLLTKLERRINGYGP